VTFVEHVCYGDASHFLLIMYMYIFISLFISFFFFFFFFFTFFFLQLACARIRFLFHNYRGWVTEVVAVTVNSCFHWKACSH
jgi:hypothetical protein